MMKIDRFTFLFLLDGIVALFALLFGTSMNVRMAAAIAAVTIVLILISIYTIYDHRLSLSSVLLLYTIATQFGLVIPYTMRIRLLWSGTLGLNPIRASAMA